MGLEAFVAWLEAPDAWLEAHEAWLETPDAWPGGTDGRTDVRTDRTKSPYSVGHRPVRGRCPKKKEREREREREKDRVDCHWVAPEAIWGKNKIRQNDGYTGVIFPGLHFVYILPEDCWLGL